MSSHSDIDITTKLGENGNQWYRWVTLRFLQYVRKNWNLEISMECDDEELALQVLLQVCHAQVMDVMGTVNVWCGCAM